MSRGVQQRNCANEPNRSLQASSQTHHTDENKWSVSPTPILTLPCDFVRSSPSSGYIALELGTI